jgi:uncharacterized protein (TIGR02147 family)
MKLKSIFEYESYKSYVLDWTTSRPKNGRGEFRRIATHLRMHTTLVSQVFRGLRNLTSEQAAELAGYFGLSETERDFLVSLVERERCGSEALRAVIDRRIEGIRLRATELTHRLPEGRDLNEVEKARFYSSWHYSAVRLMTSLQGGRDIDTLSDALKIRRSRVAEIMDFLLEHGLCIREEDAGFGMGPARIHIDARSPFVNQHHRNWRLRNMAQAERLFPKQGGETSLHEPLVFTAPMTLSSADYRKVHQMLLALIDEISRIVKNSAPECLASFAMDWMRVE